MTKLASAQAAFSATGAALRAAHEAGCPFATAEIARRGAKTPKTVAQLRSRGLVAEADARIAKAPVKAPAFAYSTPEIKAPKKAKGVVGQMLDFLRNDPAALPPEMREPKAEKPLKPAAKRDSLAAVRKDFSARMDAHDAQLKALADSMAALRDAVLASQPAKRKKA